MRRISAQYILTNTSPPLKRGIISIDDDGTIVNIENTGGELKETSNLEFYNGILIPGFVNCHCHLELSHMKGVVPEGTGLPSFLEHITDYRSVENDKIIDAASEADDYMFNEGISLCGDICNTSNTFRIKENSPIEYFNFLEVFGTDPSKAEIRIEEILKVQEELKGYKMPFSLVPHTPYSMSLSLLRLLKEKSRNNKVTSIHFMETPGEKTLLEQHSGPLLSIYKRGGITPSVSQTPASPSSAVINEVTDSGNLILVHNTFVEKSIITSLKVRKDLYWCLCPNANIYIENELPPVDLFINEKCIIVIGTDSLASNKRLSILNELITLQLRFPSLSVEELVGWGTINGAMALGMEHKYGSFETGKKPGILLLENADLTNMKLLKESTVKRLI